MISDADEEGSPNINTLLIEPWTQSQSGVVGLLNYPGAVFETSLFLNDTLTADEVLSFSIYDVRVVNLNTIGHPFDILVPDANDGHVVNNMGMLGVFDKPLRLMARVVFSIDGDSTNLYNEFDVSINLANTTAFASLMAEIQTDKLASLPLRNIQSINCWLATVAAPQLNKAGTRADNANRTAGIVDLDVFVEQLHASIECISCTGPDFDKFSELLASEDGQVNSTMLANLLMNYTVDYLMSEMFQTGIDRVLVDAARQCSHSGDASDDTTSKYESFAAPLVSSNSLQITVGLGVFGLMVVAVASISCLCTRRTISRKHRESLQGLSREEICHLYSEQQHMDNIESELCRVTKSMISSDEIPMYVRYMMPAVILGNIALFLSGHLSLGATLKTDIQLAGEDVIIEDFFEFSIADSISDMWDIDLYALAVIIFVCSVLWPYTKQMILLILWVTPPKYISVSRRTSVFMQLDSLGKWSMTDIYVLMMVLVVFRMSVESGEGGGVIPANFYGLEVMLVPLWGLFANMIAQIISQISSHFIIYYQRKIVTSGMKNSNIHDPDEADMESSTTSLALCKYEFKMRGLNSGNFAKMRLGSNIFIAMLGCVTTVMLVLGCWLTSFRLEIFGIARSLLDAGGGSNASVTEYNIFSIFGIIMKQAVYLDTIGTYVGLSALGVLLLMTSLIVPCGHCILLMVVWFCSMTRATKDTVVAGIEILKAWQYVEVYIIASFLGMWQIGDVSESLVSSACDPLEETFASLAYFGILSDENARCFYANASMEVGSYVLLVASVMLAWLSNFVLTAEKQQCATTFMGDPTSCTDEFGKDSMTELKTKIRPVASEFTDKFRWFLMPFQSGFTAETPRTFDMSSIGEERSPRSFELDDEAEVYTGVNVSNAVEKGHD